MRRIILIIVLSIYGLGNVVFPYIDFACLPDIYRSCKVEDPDMDGIDFVTEHLLSIPDFFDYSENDKDDNDKNEKPHQPLHNIITIHNVVISEKPGEIECALKCFDECATIHGTFSDQNLPAGFFSKVLRPPIV